MPRYNLNSRNLLPGAACKQYRPGEERHKHRVDLIHVSPDGTIASDGKILLRVSLPEQAVSESRPAKLTPAQFGSIGKVPARIPKAEAAEIPKFDGVMAQLQSLTPLAEITINAGHLARVLTAASKFSDDADAMVRLRYYGDKLPLRVDARECLQTGQTFLGMVGPIINGKNVEMPGDRERSTEPASKSVVPSQSELFLAQDKPRVFKEIK